MYKRKYSLKNRYLFKNIYKNGHTIYTQNLIVKYITPNTQSEKLPTNKQFAIVTSNKFTKLKPVQNRFRRMLAYQISIRIVQFPYGFYIFIPKKNSLNSPKIINVNSKELGAQVDKVLSKVVIT